MLIKFRLGYLGMNRRVKQGGAFERAAVKVRLQYESASSYLKE